MKKQNKKTKKKVEPKQFTTKKIIAMGLTVTILVWLAGLTIVVQGLHTLRNIEGENSYRLLARTAYKEAFVPLILAPESKRVYAPAMDLSFAYTDGVENLLISQDYADDQGAREFVVTSQSTIDATFTDKPSNIAFDCGKLLFVTTSESQRDNSTALAEAKLSDGRTLRAFSAGKDGACKSFRDQGDLQAATELIKSAQAYSL